PLDWPDPNQRRTPVRDLLASAYYRYRKPIFLSETGHIGSGRAHWLKEVTAECRALQEFGIPFFGICIYPITDRPDWDDLTSYSNCGIYDLDEKMNRVPDPSILATLQELGSARNCLLSLVNINT